MDNFSKRCWKLGNSKGFILLIFCIIGSIYATKSDRYFGWTNDAVKQGEPITTDGSGYYAYLPQWFTYHTSHFEFMDAVEQKYPTSKFQTGITRQTKHRFLNKYYTGTAVSLAPFYGIATLQANMYGSDQDGYSKPYLIWVNIGSIVYFLLGCVGFYCFMRRFKFNSFWIGIGLLAMAFGTNACYYSTVLVPFAHVFSFATVTWCLFFAKKWADTSSKASFWWCCFFLGWAIIIRPTNVLIVPFIPFLFGSWNAFKMRLLGFVGNEKVTLLLGVLIVSLFLSFQLFQVYVQTGQWQINTYVNESFTNWSHPEIWNVFFSWGKGLFIYAPVLLLVVPGCWMLYRKNRSLFWGWLITIALISYVVSAWWCWWYGGGLGMRVFIDFFTILFLPIVLFLQHAPKILQLVATVFIAIGIYMYQVYDFQMRHNILHYDQMTYEQFNYVFMKKDLRFQWVFHAIDDRLPRKYIWEGKLQPFKAKEQDLLKKSVTLNGPDDGDNALWHSSKLTYQMGEPLKWGMILEGTFRIQDPETIPNYWMTYFQNDSIVHQSNVYIGGKIPEMNCWKTISTVVNAPINRTQFDSVSIVLLEGGPRLAVRNLVVHSYRY
jgi:hypothetical protein